MPKYIQQRQATYGWKFQDLLFTGYNGAYKPQTKLSVNILVRVLTVSSSPQSKRILPFWALQDVAKDSIAE